jgi:hypothetical protein
MDADSRRLKGISCSKKQDVFSVRVEQPTNQTPKGSPVPRTAASAAAPQSVSICVYLRLKFLADAANRTTAGNCTFDTVTVLTKVKKLNRRFTQMDADSRRLNAISNGETARRSNVRVEQRNQPINALQSRRWCHPAPVPQRRSASICVHLRLRFLADAANRTSAGDCTSSTVTVLTKVKNFNRRCTQMYANGRG